MGEKIFFRWENFLGWENFKGKEIFKGEKNFQGQTLLGLANLFLGLNTFRVAYLFSLRVKYF